MLTWAKNLEIYGVSRADMSMNRCIDIAISQIAFRFDSQLEATPRSLQPHSDYSFWMRIIR